MVAVLSFGAYVAGLAVAGMAVALTVLVGPMDAFAVQMIVGPAVVAVAGAVGIGRVIAPARRWAAMLALVVGAAWAGAAIILVVILVPVRH